MRNLTIAIATTLALASQASFAAAQGAAPQAPSQQPAPQQRPDMKAVASGELVRVDTKAKTFTIRASAGAPTAFVYSDTTKVTGSEKTVEGLATMSGTEVTVHYTKQQEKNVATEIEIRAQQKS